MNGYTAQSQIFFCKKSDNKRKIIIKKSIIVAFDFPINLISLSTFTWQTPVALNFSYEHTKKEEVNINSMDDSFDKMFKNDEEDIGYYQDAAMQYLSEIGELKEHLTDCFERVRANRQTISIQKEREEFYEQKISYLTAELERRKANQPSQSFDPQEMENRVKTFTDLIKVDIENFQRTGIFKNIDNSINEVRDLFNIFLVDLNNLNANNRDVIGTLETLILLDV